MKHNKTLCFFLLLSGIIFNNIAQADTNTNTNQKGDAWRKRVFNYIYKINHWAPEPGTPLSGPGSTLESTTTLRTLLPAIIEAVEAKTMLDAGCGDFTWMQGTELDVEKYIGVDIAEVIIEKNKKAYSNSKYSFYCKDVAKDNLPEVDIILCRDCLAHLSNEDIILALKNFKKSGSKYLLTSTYPKVKMNNNIRTGDFRGVNLRAYPFNFPIPVMLFEEMSAESDMKRWGKWLGLWRLDDIEV